MAMNIAIYEGHGEGEINQMNRLEINDELVLTTAQLAKFYGCSTHNIVKNFNDHKKDFIEGVHYFKLIGDVLRDFKRKITESDSVTNSDSVIISPNATSFYLWTTLGAAKFAKSLRTKRAWDIYEQLAVNYFKTLPDKKSSKTSAKNALTDKEKIKFLLQAAKITKNAEMRENLIATATKIITK